jgi:hypothetical protein
VAQVVLPTPASASGLEFTLIVTKAANTGATTLIQLGSVGGTVMVDGAADVYGGTFPRGILQTTIYLTGYSNTAKYILVKLFCDGTTWFVNR